MKYAIPLGALLLVCVAAALNLASPPRAASPERRVTVVAPREAPEVRSAAMAAAPPPVSPAGSIPEIQQSAAAVTDRKVAAASTGKLTVLLDRELTLTTLQRDAVEQLLKDRDLEIKACHAAILRSGVIDIPQYEWQAGLMKEGWYRKIDALLDRAQHERLLALVQKGFFNEGLAFTVEPGMTVLD